MLEQEALQEYLSILENKVITIKKRISYYRSLQQHGQSQGITSSVLSIISDLQSPFRTDNILEILEKQNFIFKKASTTPYMRVASTLTRMYQQGLIIRVEYGLYKATQNTAPSLDPYSK